MDKRNIIIAGGGTTGWLTAAILAKGLPADEFHITLIESPDIPTIGVGEATIPPITQLISYLEINELAFLSAIQATYKYGIHFENWSKIGHSYMHAFGELGSPFNQFSFPYMWLAYQQSLNLPSLSFFSPTATAAYSGKFSPPRSVENRNKNYFYPLSNLFYAYQFDAGLLAQFLKQYALKLGIAFIPATINAVITASHTGIEHAEFPLSIAGLTLDNGKSIKGDIFIDCTGQIGLLNKKSLKCPFTSWRSFLPCDRAVVVQTRLNAPAFPFTKSIAMDFGWRWQIPLRERNGNGYVYSSRFVSDDIAMQSLKNALSDQEALTEYRTIKFETGILESPWTANSIALGLAAGFYEPLESTSIHLVHKYAIKLKNSLIYGTDMADEAKIFNLAFKQDGLAIRDFLVLHYKLTERCDTPFWQHCKSMFIPDSLTYKIDEFAQTGYINLEPASLFQFQSYFQVLVGQGFSIDPLLIDKLLTHPDLCNRSTEEVQYYFDSISAAIKHEVSSLPKHQSYLVQEQV